MPFILPQKVYEVIRWVISIVFPEAILLFAIIAGEFHIPHSESIIKIVAGVGSFLGAIFCVSKLSYDLKNKNKEECDLDFGQNH